MDALLAWDATCAERVIGARVNGQLCDTRTALCDGDTVQPVTFDDEAGKQMLWHSTAHMLGNALELHLPQVRLCDGPALSPDTARGSISEGFFYEFHIPSLSSSISSSSLSNSFAASDESAASRAVSKADFDKLTAAMMALAAQKRKFERLQLSAAAAREMFAYNSFKLELIDAILRRGSGSASAVGADDGNITVYRCGDFIDLCRGPHIPNTGRVRFAQLTLLGSTHANSSQLKDTAAEIDKNNNNNNDKNSTLPNSTSSTPSSGSGSGGVLLHRVYGVSFPSVEAGRAWQARVAASERRDHRAIAVRQSLVMFSELAVGSAFFLPDGTYVYNRLLEMLRAEVRECVCICIFVKLK